MSKPADPMLIVRHYEAPQPAYHADAAPALLADLPAPTLRIPHAARALGVTGLLIVAAFVSGFALNWTLRATVVHQTRTVHVEKSWGNVTRTVDGASVSEALAGLTCDVYAGRKTVVCRP